MKEYLRVHVDHVAKLWDSEIFQKTLLEEQKEQLFYKPGAQEEYPYVLLPVAPKESKQQQGLQHLHFTL